MEFEFKAGLRSFPAEHVIYTTITLPFNELRDAYKEFMKLGIHLFTNGGRAAGPCYMRYINETAHDSTIEVCLVIEAPMPETGDIKYRETPPYEGHFATAYCKGPYNALPAAYGEFGTWFVNSGHMRKPEPMIERFINYRPHMDENELLTELIWPIVE